MAAENGIVGKSRIMSEDAANRALNLILSGGEPLDPAPIDKEQIFMIYAGCCGDVAKTARACGVSLQQVIEFAEAGSWLSRIGELIDLKKLDKFDDVSRGISRAMNFMQANRFRLYLERVIQTLSNDSDEKLLERFETKKVTKDGEVVITGVSLRMLADVASAMEKIHWAIYQALCDSTPERTARRAQEKPDDTLGEADIHAKIAKAMAGMRMKTVTEASQEALDKAIEGNPPVS